MSKRVYAPAGQPLGPIYKRITEAEWALAFVSLLPEQPANVTLLESMRSLVPGLAVAAVPFADIVKNPLASALVEHYIAQSGLNLGGIPTGYYLLHQGEVVAYNPCTPNADELKAGAVVGVVSGIISALAGSQQAFGDGFKATSATWEVSAGARAYEHFRQFVDGVRARKAWEDFDWSKFSRFAEELQKQTVHTAFRDACQLIGVSMDATKEDFKRAYRSKALEFHPDRSGGSDQKMKALNEARALYTSRRGWK